MDIHVMPNKSEAELTPEEKWRVEHIKMHEKHRGHESMHAEMLLILLVTLIVAQVVLVEWKKRHHKSYQEFSDNAGKFVSRSSVALLFPGFYIMAAKSGCQFQVHRHHKMKIIEKMVTLVAMWIIPFGLCIKNQWWRFIFLWQVFSCITWFIVRKALQRPIQGTTPRLVYKWFYFIYKLSYTLGIIGYVIMLATIFGFNLIFDVKPHIWMDCGLLFVFYGLYFGVLGRDIAEICADKMASHIGYYAPGSMPTRTLEPGVCAVCGNRLLVSENEEGVIENTYKLSCDHVFHEFCIRGWCIVGKKQTCPYCKEKVDLKKMFCSPWERPHVLYGQLLDWIRWLVAWQPLILFLVQGINWALGLDMSLILQYGLEYG